MAPVVLRPALVLLGALAVGVLGNAVHPAGLSLGQPVRSLAEEGQCSAPPPGAQGRPAAGGAVEPARALQPMLLSPRDAAALRGQAGVVFGDLRPPGRYAEGHVAGALHLPCAGSLGQAALSRLPPRTRLVLYDEDGRSQELSTAAATALLRGLAEVVIIEGGFAGWSAAGLPAESGPCDGCSAH